MDEIKIQINRILQVGVRWMGLQRTAATVLAALYFQDCKSESRLSAKEISNVTGLSSSTVSSICSQLASLGLIIKQTDSQKGRGRRRSVFFLRGGLSDVLKLGIRRNLDQVRRILKDIDALRNGPNGSDTLNQMTINRITGEIGLFLSEPWTM
ncbi:MAG: MarR family transcriptional regulator [Candidatus Thorarchaeota archaeon]